MMGRRLAYLVFVGSICILNSSCSLFYKECEILPPDNIIQATIAGNEEEISVWYDVPIEGTRLHIYQPTHAIRHSQLVQSLSLMGINEIDLGTSKHDSVVAVEYFLNDSSCINNLGNIDCFKAAFVFFSRNMTLHTRFFYIANEGAWLLEKVNSTPKYMAPQNGYKALELLDIGSKPVAYLKMLDPSAANRAREGKEGDFLTKVNLYLEANKK